MPIRQLSTILETLGDYAPRQKDLLWLAEYCRHRLARTICSRYMDGAKQLRVVTLDPALEDRIAAGVEVNERGIFIRMSPAVIQATCQKIAGEVEKLTRAGFPPLVLVSPQVRPLLKQLTGKQLPRLTVLSYNEVTRDTRIEAVGMVGDLAPTK